MSSQGFRGYGWEYVELKAVVGVFLMNFEVAWNLRSNDKIGPAVESKFRTDVVLADKESGRVLSDKIRMIFLQLPLFKPGKPEDCHTDFERWIFTLKHMETLERMPFEAKKAVFARLARICAQAKLVGKDKANYEASLKAYRDANAIRKYYETAEDTARADGKAEGLVEGKAMGKAEGIAIGEKMAEAKLMETAKTLSEMGLPLDSIAKAVGLPEVKLREMGLR